MKALINCRIITMGKEDYDQGRIIIEQGRIKAVGNQLPLPAGAEIIDLQGKTVLPGLIDPHCHLGIYEEIYRIEGNDANEYSEPVTPELRALDGINPFDQGFRDGLQGGVTTVGVCPGSANVIGGLCLAMKTHGHHVDQMVIKESVGMKIAFGENPKRVYGEQKKKPMTRMAIASLLRQALEKAIHYRERKMAGKEPLEKNLGMEQLMLVLDRVIPLRAHAHRADDIATALRIAKEYQVDIIIEHCTEGHLLADELAIAQIPTILGPALINRAKVELKERTFATPGILAEAGIPVALCTDHPATPIQYLSLCAALAVREGMTERDALKAITIIPATILGIDHQVGSIEPGKDADLVVVEESILDIKTPVEMVFVNGEQVI